MFGRKSQSTNRLAMGRSDVSLVAFPSVARVARCELDEQRVTVDLREDARGRHARTVSIRFNHGHNRWNHHRRGRGVTETGACDTQPVALTIEQHDRRCHAQLRERTVTSDTERRCHAELVDLSGTR